MNSIGITAEELWEHRNSLLHMSSLESRKVISGDIRSLMGFLGTIPQNVKLSEDKIGYYDIQKLIFCIAEACGKWGDTYENKREKIDSFIERYDLIASDARLLKIEYGRP